MTGHRALCLVLLVGLGCAPPASSTRVGLDESECDLVLPPPHSPPTSPRRPASEEVYPSDEPGGFGALHFGACTSGDCLLRCSAEGYDRVDYCYDEASPERPSLMRRVGASVLRAHDGVARRGEYGMAQHAYLRPQAGDTQILPDGRTSVDGRLVYAGGYQAWPTFSLFRPGLVGYDHQVGGNADGYPSQPRAGHTAGTGQVGELHALAYMNPQDTSLTFDEIAGRGFVNALHTTLCEDSDQATLGERPRSPVPCIARYGEFRYGPEQDVLSSDDEERRGLCYQVSLLGGVASNTDGRWELRSGAYTVFVEDALTDTVGEAAAGEDRSVVWIYPQAPGGTAMVAGPHEPVRLPDYAAYHLARLFPWNADFADLAGLGRTEHVEWTRGAEHVAVPGRCYGGADLTPHPDAPPWCEFLFGQSRAETMTFDLDRDSAIDRPGVVWDGHPSSMPGAALFEPTVTADGRLLVINQNRALMYSVATGAACEAAGFADFVPISHMPFDAEASGYRLAQTGGEPFRDSGGEPIEPGSLQRFAYGWIDRPGTNLAFAMSNEQRDVWRMSGARGVWRVPTSGEPDLSGYEPAVRLESGNAGAGHHIAILGAWTRHKMVVLDNGMNATDFGGPGGPGYEIEYTLPLYEGASLATIAGRVSQIGSFENQFGAYRALRPTLPFDVVWTVQGNNDHNAEIAFDEYLDPHAFIVAHMNAAVRVIEERTNSTGTSSISVEDGFVPEGSYFGGDPNYHFQGDPNYRGPGARALLQNAAGDSPVASLRVRGGARIEPVALGGVLGKGIWLDGINDFVDATYPRTEEHDWYYGVWADLRGGGRVARAIFHFADGSFVGYRYSWEGLEFVLTDASGHERTLPAPAGVRPGRYFHLGVRSETAYYSRRVTVLVNGDPIGSLRFWGSGMADAMACDGEEAWISLGAANDGVASARGWFDELRVYRLPEGDRGAWLDELHCNLALGTLVRTDGPVEGGGLTGARAAPQLDPPQGEESYRCEQLVVESHDRPTDLAPQFGRSVCADRVHRGGGPMCARPSALDFRTLYADSPRPDSRTPFCLSCHQAGSPLPSLGVGALHAGSGPRFEEGRRQPMDAPAVQHVPPLLCDGTDTLSGNWLAALPLFQEPYTDGTYTIDHMIDSGRLESLGAGSRYIPPSESAPPSCTDGLFNGDETGVDCGGPCWPCSPSGCGRDEDCGADQQCVFGVCQTVR